MSDAPDNTKLILALHADVTTGFKQVNARFEQVNADMAAGFKQVDDRFDRIERRLGHLETA